MLALSQNSLLVTCQNGSYLSSEQQQNVMTVSQIFQLPRRKETQHTPYAHVGAQHCMSNTNDYSYDLLLSKKWHLPPYNCTQMSALPNYLLKKPNTLLSYNITVATDIKLQSNGTYEAVPSWLKNAVFWIIGTSGQRGTSASLSSFLPSLKWLPPAKIIWWRPSLECWSALY